MSVLTTFIIKKIQTWTEPKSGKDEPNRTVSSEPRVTDISVNRGNPNINWNELRRIKRIFPNTHFHNEIHNNYYWYCCNIEYRKMFSSFFVSEVCIAIVGALSKVLVFVRIGVKSKHRYISSDKTILNSSIFQIYCVEIYDDLIY